MVIMCSDVFAQRTHIGIFGGASAYSGDLTEGVFPKKVTNGAIGVTVNYELSDLLTLRSGFTYSIVGGADRYSKKSDLVLRNLSFETKIFEFSTVAEYNVLNLDYSQYTPYVFAGLALVKYNPYAYDVAGQKVYLKPLSTEGQGLLAYPGRRPYSLTQLAIPFGGGIKFAVSKKIRIAGEFGLRKLFTDYLDDVGTTYVDPVNLVAARGQLAVDMSYRGDELSHGSASYPPTAATRGNPKSKDYYYFAGLHVTYRLTPGRKNEVRCPNIY